MDVIVMCTHGEEGVGSHICGSISDRVTRSATIPVTPMQLIEDNHSPLLLQEVEEMHL